MTAPPIENGAATGGEEKVPLDAHKIKALRAALPQVLATSAKNLLLLGYGMTLGFPTITIPAITAGSNSTDVLQLTREQISWFSSINLICVPVGCMVSGALTQPLGRKRAMQFVNIPFIAAWLLFYFASSLAELYLALVLTGLGGGLMEAPVLTYVAEITQPHLRGMLSATSSMCVILGIFVQFLFGNFLYWRTVAVVNVAFPLVAAVALCFVPESPYWLVTKRRYDEAERALCWLRGWVSPVHVQEEFRQLKESLEEPPQGKDSKGQSFDRREAWWKPYTRRTFLQPYMIVSVAFFIGHFSGMTTLQTFSVSIFATLGAPVDKYVATLYLGVAELAGTLVCVVLVHWAGKRPLTFVSAVGSGACFLATATYAHVYNAGTDATGTSPADASSAPFAWLPLTLLLAAAFLSHCAIRLLPWILIGEVYPAAVRGVASGASGSIGYIFSFAANKTYFHLLSGLTLPGAFWLYGVVALVGSAFLWWTLPETEGRTLHEIELHFAGERDLLNARRDEKKLRRRRQQQLQVAGQELTTASNGKAVTGSAVMVAAPGVFTTAPAAPAAPATATATPPAAAGKDVEQGSVNPGLVLDDYESHL